MHYNCTWFTDEVSKIFEYGFVGLLYLMEPVIALVFAWFVFREYVTAKEMIGASLILISAVISEFPFGKFIKNIFKWRV